MRNFIIISMICLILPACGFHLRTQNNLPIQLHTLYLQSARPYSLFMNNLRQTLHTLDVQTVDSPNQAPITLRILNSTMTHTTPIIVSSNQARNYTYTLSTAYDLIDRQGKIILPAQSINISRDITLATNQTIDDIPEVDIVSREIENETIHQIINRLRAREISDLIDRNQ